MNFQQLTSWSFPPPVPEQNAWHQQQNIYDQKMDFSVHMDASATLTACCDLDV